MELEQFTFILAQKTDSQMVMFIGLLPQNSRLFIPKLLSEGLDWVYPKVLTFTTKSTTVQFALNENYASNNFRLFQISSLERIKVHKSLS
jgi:hypothetical protein